MRNGGIAGMRRTRARRVALAVAAIALAVWSAACTSDDPEPPPPAAESTPATAAPTTARATATPTVQPTPADPSDTYFDLGRVLDIAIEIAPEDWETLRHQTRTFEDLLAEIERYQLSRPFADIYTWFPATVTVDGETHHGVGVRKKGFLGSQSETRPSLKLRFDRYVDGQALGGDGAATGA